MDVRPGRRPLSPRPRSGRPGPSARRRRRPLVEELEAYVLLSNIFTVTSNADNGSGTVVGSLSWAIDQVDADHGDSASNPDEIAFSVGSGGAQTISVTATLPLITRPVIVDGTTEPGFSTTTHIPLVQIDGSSSDQGTDGLQLASGAADSTIKGLDLTGFGTEGLAAIEIDTTGVRVVGNDLGFTTAGVAAPNGVGVDIDGSNNTIGGTTPASRNVISGNSLDGIFLSAFGASATGNLIEGNYLGTDVTGAEAVPNGIGIGISNATNNTIGGTAPGAGNVISGNSEVGVDFDGNELIGGPTSGNIVEGNLIGTDATGTMPLGNRTLGGIYIYYEASGNTIGGTAPGAGNVIAANSGGGVTFASTGTSGNVVEGNDIGTNVDGATGLGNSAGALGNPGDGVRIDSNCSNDTVGGASAGAGNVIADNGGNGVSVGNTNATNTVDDAVLSNSIYSNAGLGIDLGDDGVTLNNSEGQTGPNLNQNFPVITSATLSTTTTTIAGTLNSTANTTFTIQFFASAAADPTGYGEGQTYLGQTTVTTGASGSATISATVAQAPSGQAVITATATDPNGDTSEFSLAITGSGSSSNPLVVTNTNDSGPGSLRSAIQYADTRTGLQTITFQIPGSGVQTIQPMTALPLITTPVTINGESQMGYAGAPLIRIDGSSTGQYVNGLELAYGSSGSTIEGLDITDFGGGTGNGIQIDAGGGEDLVIANYLGFTTAGVAAPNGVGVYVEGTGSTVGGTSLADRNVISGNAYFGVDVDGYNVSTSGNLVEGNYIGTDPTGTKALANKWGLIVTNATGNTIGGTAAGAANVISGNNEAGVYIDGNSLYGGVTTGNVVEGNLIGTDKTGTKPLGNVGLGGILIAQEASGNTIGGTATGAANTIAGNGVGGVLVNDSSGNLVEGNLIGTDAAGDSGLGNSGDGVDIAQDASDNTVGGTLAGAGNVIADNHGNGVTIGYDGDDSVGDTIVGNSIFGNTSLGIDLGDDGVTKNGSEGTSGPNLFQQFPVITSAELASSGAFAVAGTVEGPKSTTVTVSLYANPSADPSGYGQGQIYLGSVQVSIGASGTGTISGFSTNVTLHTGEVISATTTDAAGDTSEFSQDFAIVPGPDIITPMVRIQSSGFSVSRSTHQYTQTITITNTSGSAINGPIYLELDDLPSGVTLLTPSTPAPDGGGPAVEVSSGGLGVGQSVTVTLVFANPGNIVINYVPELLSNPFGGTEN